ncbi:MAG: hypothetical protein AB1420_03690 [Bacillota bacterium]
MSCYSALLLNAIEIEGRKVVVLLAGTRENFYQELKRFIKK